MNLADFNYELPNELIARYPLEKRSGSRLLCINKKSGELSHKQFQDILSFVLPHDLLVFNNTRVIPARLLGTKESGGKIEVLVERILDSKRILAHVRASKTPKPDSLLCFQNEIKFKVIARRADLFELQCEDPKPVMEIIEAIGHVPLPPYLQRQAEKDDTERYQTIYAEHKGSVAAPTAGLHFDEEIMQKLREKQVDFGFVTLHVGAGTFAPVRVENIHEHKMHAEYLEVSEKLCQQISRAKQHGGRVIAVGTTSTRALETASRSGKILPHQGDTDIFIYPGFQFQCVDAMLTNLHLPGSTLLMLVAALAGYENMMNAYREAVQNKYRFFSYGDAMWIE